MREPTHQQALQWGLPAAEVEAARQRDLSRLRWGPQPKTKAQRIAYIKRLAALVKAGELAP